MGKEIVAMILAGGRGTRLKELTAKVAKPAVHFGGKYRIIDFPLSNCANSGIDIVGVLTQYESVLLGTYVGAGTKWGLDGANSLAAILPARERDEVGATWYAGTADAIYQNLDFLDRYDPEYVLILSGDHIYKMEYDQMLAAHKQRGADATIAVLNVSLKEASRFGIMNAHEDGTIYEFEEKPEHPKSTLASMGIYIFSWPVLRDALIHLKDEPGCDFGKHIIPYCHGKGDRIFAYEYNGYWKDVGTLGSYWEANMELIDIIPEFNLYEEYWKIYTKSDVIPPQYIASEAHVERSIIGEGTEIYGEVINSVIGAGVTIAKGAVVKDSIVMQGSVIGASTSVEKAIIAENVKVGSDVQIGVGEYAPSTYDQKVYQFDLATIGENSIIPDGVKIGKNTAIAGETTVGDYPDGLLASGNYIIKAGGVK